jgi:hypothetical protein
VCARNCTVERRRETQQQRKEAPGPEVHRSHRPSRVEIPPAIAGGRNPMVAKSATSQGVESLLLFVPECGVARYGNT